jgi:hypothetical protein
MGEGGVLLPRTRPARARNRSRARANRLVRQQPPGPAGARPGPRAPRGARPGPGRAMQAAGRAGLRARAVRACACGVRMRVRCVRARVLRCKPGELGTTCARARARHNAHAGVCAAHRPGGARDRVRHGSRARLGGRVQCGQCASVTHYVLFSSLPFELRTGQCQRPRCGLSAACLHGSVGRAHITGMACVPATHPGARAPSRPRYRDSLHRHPSRRPRSPQSLRTRIARCDMAGGRPTSRDVTGRPFCRLA